MPSTCSLRSAGSWLGVLALIALPGCKSGSSESDSSDYNLQQIHQAIGRYIEEAGNNPEEFEGKETPQSPEDLHKHLRDNGHDNPEEILKSPHDGQPYVILWNVTYMEGGEEEDPSVPVLAHEASEVNGKRWVLLANGITKRMTHEEFEQAKARVLAPPVEPESP